MDTYPHHSLSTPPPSPPSPLPTSFGAYAINDPLTHPLTHPLSHHIPLTPLSLSPHPHLPLSAYAINDPRLATFVPADLSNCTNAADNPVHVTLQDKLIGEQQVGGSPPCCGLVNIYPFNIFPLGSSLLLCHLQFTPIHPYCITKQVIYTRRTKYMAISALTSDYMDSTGWQTTTEGELDNGNLISFISEMGQVDNSSFPSFIPIHLYHPLMYTYTFHPPL